MTYPSVDAMQKALASSVFSHATDKKKAAGRALGTIIELISFHLLQQWKLGPNMSIELKLPEFGNPDITHNVEFGLHPIHENHAISIKDYELPLTARKLVAALKSVGVETSGLTVTSHQLLCAIGAKGQEVLLRRNACEIAVDEKTGRRVVANILAYHPKAVIIDVSVLRQQPFAIVECKRVGVEDGARKGPTTIEKAKQGAYVAKHASSLQKVRLRSGTVIAAFANPKGDLEYLGPYDEVLDGFIHREDVARLQDFVLTVGIASNHGNWFTADDPNKELRVLKQSYDWLLFLNDGGG